jgi:hypothetical protein
MIPLGLTPHMVMGTINGAMISTLYMKPGLENLGADILLLTGGMVCGPAISGGAWLLSQLGQAEPDQAYWYQDVSAATSILLVSGNVAMAQEDPATAAKWGWGLELGELVIQRGVRSSWGQDPARLELLSRLQWNLALTSFLSFQENQYEKKPSSALQYAPLALWPAQIALAASFGNHSVQEERSRGNTLIALNAVAAPIASWIAVRNDTGSDAASRAVLGVHVACLLALPLIPTDLGESIRGNEAVGGAVYGGLLGLTIQFTDSERSRIRPSDATMRQRNWLLSSIGSTVGFAIGWTLGNLSNHPARQSLELEPPGIQLASDRSLAMSLGGLRIHLD